VDPAEHRGQWLAAVPDLLQPHASIICSITGRLPEGGVRQSNRLLAGG
jgi:hypothetical protein